MKKKLSILIVMVLSILLVGCGKKEVKMKPASTAVLGDLAECYEVVDQECVIKLEKGKIPWGSEWRVKLRRTDKPLPFTDEVKLLDFNYSISDSKYCHVGFGMKIMDQEDYTYVEHKPKGSGCGANFEDIEALLKLKSGEVGEITLEADDDDKILEAKSALKFIITSYCEVNEPYESSGTSSSSYSEAAGSADWDKILDDYEEYVNKSIKLYNQAKSSKTASTMKQLEDMEEQLINISAKLEKAEGSMSTAQMQRFSKITTKYANISMKMSDLLDDYDDWD